MKTIYPVGQKVLVSPLPKREEKIGSVLISATANAELAEGLVIDAAPRYKELYQKGDMVLYVAKSGVGVIHHGKPALILDGGNDNNQGDIFSKVVEDGEGE